METILITGGTSGLGLELVKLFLEKGFTVYTTGRDGKQISGLSERVKFVKVDFSDLTDVRNTIQNLLDRGVRFDIVINNAGVLTPPGFTTCSNGIEYAFQVNFLSHLLIDELIIKKSDYSNTLIIVSVTSPVYKWVKPDFRFPVPVNYRSFKTYSESKYYMLLIGDYFMNKYPIGNLKFIGFNPGIFSSGIYRMQKNWFHKMYHIGSPFMQKPEKVANALADVLTGMEIINGTIYRSKKRYSVLKSVNNKSVTGFLADCRAFIGQYL